MTIGILGAMEVEIAPLLDKVYNVKKIVFPLGAFYQAEYGGEKVILGVTGTQKTNAAAATQALITLYEPRLILYTGVAGALHSGLDLGDVVIGSTLIHHDAGFLYGNPHDFIPCGPRIEIGADRNESAVWGRVNRFHSDGKLVEAAVAVRRQLPQELSRITVKEGVIATGDQVIFSGLKRTEIGEGFSALAVEMEGAAFAQVAWTNRIPFLVIRGISDNANEKSITEETVRQLVTEAPLSEIKRDPEMVARLKQAAMHAALFTLATVDQLQAVAPVS